MNNPSWWTTDDSNAWGRVREALRRDWEQTKHDLHAGGHELNQGLRDTIEQGRGREPMPPIDEANPPRVIGRWEDVEMPIGYGFAARTHFGDKYPRWTEALEQRLASDWKAERPWSEVRHYVRHGYELKQ